MRNMGCETGEVDYPFSTVPHFGGVGQASKQPWALREACRLGHVAGEVSTNNAPDDCRNMACFWVTVSSPGVNSGPFCRSAEGGLHGC